MKAYSAIFVMWWWCGGCIEGLKEPLWVLKEVLVFGSAEKGANLSVMVC